ncbi:metal ABC transporter solute-binding protein, Zn/Mn family [Desertibacillus haloalkaliphilus]|uniref:metal ABC transporter solute-binding protein, Zn/Mn family n=1 Tax=Desertibacillus haloalkaliphilus TaxID=1328930 RepID=UPI001C27AA5D|nr:zinc ABC transporter substrate-binding protein [Desertibacillus haloalkaliphilus]MBU8908810.1 zinc ABC transporter substrate-binding protein [Desertibacillus haloalkaliphilus]
MKVKASFFFAIIIVLSSFLAACGNQQEDASETNENEEETSNETLDIFTTIFPLEDFTKKIGGDYVNVTNVVPVGGDAHTFEPTPQTMVDIAESDAFFYNGIGMEGFADAVIDSVGEELLVVKASEGIDLIAYDHDHGHEHEEQGHEEDHDHGHEHEEQGHEEDHDHGHEHEEHSHEEDHDHGHEHEDQGHEEEHNHEGDDGHNHDHGDGDPHIWLDPILSIQVAENIKDALVELLPEAAEEFQANFEVVKEELEGLDQEFQEMVDEASKNTFIVSHAGFGYWEERYGLQQMGITGLSPTNEPSAKQLEGIIDFANDNNINYILFEQNITTQVAEVVQEEVGAEALDLHNLEALVQEDIDNDEDYFSLMRSNIESLRTALQ